MPPAEHAKMGYLGRALASGARPFHYRAAVRTLLTGVGAVAPLHGAHLPLPGLTYASPAPGFDQRGAAEFSGVAPPTAPVRAPASPQTGSSAGTPPRRERSEPTNEYGHRPPSAVPQPGADAPRMEHQRFGSETKTESQSETQAVSIAPQLVAIPESKRVAPAELASAVMPKVARLAPSAPPIADRARRHDPIATANLHPADRQRSPGPVEHAARLPDAAPGPQPNLALRTAAPQRARADLVSETPGRSPSQHPTPPLVPSPNTRMASLDRTAPGQRAPRPEPARTTMSTPTRASADPTHQRALRTLEQLRHTVQALVTNPQAAQPAAAASAVPPPAPPAPKVVVVKQSADQPRRGSAFWERRYLGHPQLRVFR
jgi:hypothetical protein